MANIFVSIPILGKPELKMIYSLYQAILSCRDHKVRVYFNENDSLISRVRNVHVSVFANEYKDCEYFMSLDSDLEIINVYSTNNIFSKLVSHNIDFVGGLYAVKKQGVKKCSSITFDGSTPQFDTGLVEMGWLSTGCWCLKRSVIERMIAEYPELTYDGDDNVSGKKIHGLYIPKIHEVKKGDFPNANDLQLPFKKYLSEDWSFSQRWKQMGGKIYADTSIVLNHIGKFSYSLWDVKVVKKDEKEKPHLPPAGYDLNMSVEESNKKEANKLMDIANGIK